MAVTYATGWNAGVAAYYTEQGWLGSHTLVTTVAKLHKSADGVGSAYALEMNNTSGNAWSPAIATSSRFLHFYYIAGNTVAPVNNDLYFYRDGTATAQLRIASTGQITVSRGTSTTYTSNTILATSAANINPNVGHWVAVELNAADAAGTFTVWVDGVQMVTFAGDTQGHTTSAWDRFGFKQGANSLDDWYISDIIVTDNTTGRLPEQWCQVLVPSSVDSGNLTGVAVTGASRYQNVDEIPVSQTDYCYAVAVNDEDLYNFSDLGVSFSSIALVSVSTEATRAGGITGGQLSVKSGATTSYDSTFTMPSSVVGWSRYLLVDPDTTAAWTSSGVNAAAFGLKFV